MANRTEPRVEAAFLLLRAPLGESPSSSHGTRGACACSHCGDRPILVPLAQVIGMVANFRTAFTSAILDPSPWYDHALMQSLTIGSSTTQHSSLQSPYTSCARNGSQQQLLNYYATIIKQVQEFFKMALCPIARLRAPDPNQAGYVTLSHWALLLRRSTCHRLDRGSPVDTLPLQD